MKRKDIVLNLLKSLKDIKKFASNKLYAYVWWTIIAFIAQKYYRTTGDYNEKNKANGSLTGISKWMIQKVWDDNNPVPVTIDVPVTIEYKGFEMATTRPCDNASVNKCEVEIIPEGEN